VAEKGKVKSEEEGEKVVTKSTAVDNLGIS